MAFLYFCPDFASLIGQPSFLLVQQENRAFHKLIHSLVRSTLDILLDHLFQVRTKLNLHGHSFLKFRPARITPPSVHILSPITRPCAVLLF
jgi:hypothetical protein